jgi:hypothetical protein
MYGFLLGRSKSFSRLASAVLLQTGQWPLVAAVIIWQSSQRTARLSGMDSTTTDVSMDLVTSK